MSGLLRGVDRVACLLFGLLFVLGGLSLLDWRYRLVFDNYPDALTLGPVPRWVAADWWPWAAGAAGIGLLLLGLWWLLAHLRRSSIPDLTLAGTDHTGRLSVDLSSVADAAGATLLRSGPFATVHATARTVRRARVVELQTRISEHADTASLLKAAQQATRQVREAFPDGGTHARILINPPRPQRSWSRRASGTPRVH